MTLTTNDPVRARRPLPGVLVAGVTALVSGVSVFVNSYGVHHVTQPAVYTTGKNLVAGALLGIVVCVAAARGPRRAAVTTPVVPVRRRLPHVLALAYVGVIGGGLAFVLFFTGLAHSSAEPAAFLHDTMVVWVGVLATAFLGERPSVWNAAAIGLLMAGQVLVTGGIGHLVAGRGEVLVLLATGLWAIETVVAKPLLRVVDPLRLGALRMGVGAAVLTVYLAVTGHLGTLFAVRGDQMAWMALTGVLLSLYVATWMTALARARAVDVTSVLVGSVVVTAVLSALAGKGGLAPEALGLALVGCGVVATLVAWPRRALA